MAKTQKLESDFLRLTLEVIFVKPVAFYERTAFFNDRIFNTKNNPKNSVNTKILVLKIIPIYGRKLRYMFSVKCKKILNNENLDFQGNTNFRAKFRFFAKISIPR